MQSDHITGPPGVGVRLGSVVRDVTHPTWAGVVVDEIDGMVLVCWRVARDDMRWRGTRHLCLDLTDPTSRAHAVWAIAKRLGLPDPDTAALRWRGGHGWDIVADRPMGVYPGGQPEIDSYQRRCVPATTTGMRRLMDRRGMQRLFVEVPTLRDIPADRPDLAIAAIMAHLWGQP